MYGVEPPLNTAQLLARQNAELDIMRRCDQANAFARMAEGVTRSIAATSTLETDYISSLARTLAMPIAPTELSLLRTDYSPILEMQREQERIRQIEEQIGAIARRAAQQATIDITSEGYANAIAAECAASAAKINVLTDRLMREDQWLKQFVGALDAAIPAFTSAVVSPVLTDKWLGILLDGLDETGLTDSTSNWELALNAFQKFLASFPPDVRAFVIALLASFITGTLPMIILAECSNQKGRSSVKPPLEMRTKPILDQGQSGGNGCP